MIDGFIDSYSSLVSKGFLANVNWRDLIDILLLSVIFYNFLRFLQGTKTLRVMIGLLFMILTYFITTLFDLKAVNWIFENFFSSFILIMIVLFQEDIRNALARFGKTPFFWESENSKDNVAKIVTGCCDFFSKTNTGALIVFEKDIGIRDLQVGGTLIQGRISKSLISTIFNKHTALHDGAMVIKEDIIEIVGCILPLSSSLDSESGYGTRHRAGLGITEKSDSIALIVSEETGKITLAQNGKLSTVKPEILEKLLINKLK